MYDVRAKTVPKNPLDKFAKISTKDHYNMRLSGKKCSSFKFSRTEKWKSLLLELVCLFGILFHFLLKLLTCLIFVKNKITTPYSRKGLFTNCRVSLFVFCSVLLYWRSLAKASSRQTPIGHLRVKKTSHFQTRVLCENKFYLNENHFHINDYALSLALKKRIGTNRKWLLKSWLYCPLAITKLLRKLGQICPPKQSHNALRHNTYNLGQLKSRMKQCKAKTRHFPILDLRGGGGGHKFLIYFVQDCSKLFSSTTSKSPI